MKCLPVSVRSQMYPVDMEVGVDKPAHLTIVPNSVLSVKSVIRIEIVGHTV